jgi:hypothetical protein
LQNHKDHKISVIGKWHRYSLSNGYTEFDIDSQYVVFYNQKAGRFKFGYKIENDSFKYIGHNYAAKFTAYGDSIFFQGNDNTNATLYRFNESEIPFSCIPDEKDSLAFESYLKSFDERTVQAFEKTGIKFFDKKEEISDTTFQQLLNNKKNH